MHSPPRRWLLSLVISCWILCPIGFGLYQWNTVVPIVLNSPWVGIGFEWPEMVQGMSFFVLPSINSLWLILLWFTAFRALFS